MNRRDVEILLIEDNPDEAELTIRSLRTNNLAGSLLHIDDGAEALDFIFSNGSVDDKDSFFCPKLILLDLKLPKIDGLEVLRRIKEDERTKRIPVVILTSSKEERDVVESYKLGVNSYMVKPVNFRDFSSAVNDLGLYWLLRNQPPPPQP
jgi:two-component system response regulator